jgi:hypothetical protein
MPKKPSGHGRGRGGHWRGRGTARRGYLERDIQTSSDRPESAVDDEQGSNNGSSDDEEEVEFQIDVPVAMWVRLILSIRVSA